MGQVKKKEIREAIIAGAHALFRDKGYNDTTVAEIGRAAGIATSNIYIYFDSKLDVLFAIYDPYLRQRFAQLASDLELVQGPDERLRLILRAVWHDIPRENNAFANNLMQGLSTVKADENISRDLLGAIEAQLAGLVQESLPADRIPYVDVASLVHMMMKAFDGFSIDAKLSGRSEKIDEAVEMMVALLLGRPVCPHDNGHPILHRQH